MELIKVGEKTYYIKNPTNIGIYKVDEKNVYLIDSGNDKDAGKKILNIINEQGWSVKAIIPTHSHADHIGGNRVIQDRTGCKIFGYNIEQCFTKNPILEPAFLYGGYPFKDLKNKFLLAKESEVLPIENNLPQGLEYFPLKGHYFDMIGIKTSDDVYFLGDSLVSENTINKYHVFFLYDVKEYLNTLDYLETLEGNLYIPSHVEATEDIKSVVNANREKVNEIANKICEICEEEKTFEDILQKIFEQYNLQINSNQFVLVGSTIRSYLSYLFDEQKLIYDFKDNKMYWKKV